MRPDAYKQKVSRIWKKKNGITIVKKNASLKKQEELKEGNATTRQSNHSETNKAKLSTSNNKLPLKSNVEFNHHSSKAGIEESSSEVDSFNESAMIEDEEIEELLYLMKGAESNISTSHDEKSMSFNYFTFKEDQVIQHFMETSISSTLNTERQDINNEKLIQLNLEDISVCIRSIDFCEFMDPNNELQIPNEFKATLNHMYATMPGTVSAAGTARTTSDSEIRISKEYSQKKSLTCTVNQPKKNTNQIMSMTAAKNSVIKETPQPSNISHKDVANMDTKSSVTLDNTIIASSKNSINSNNSQALLVTVSKPQDHMEAFLDDLLE